ncbi:C-type lectin 37Db-like [Drosophila biarmipes]|uniref:C-type lectin 37Db-like n=1 Tax=Drosophila biarmipes TaxID=125945 RepID=UPI0007E88298|nr:C-type lectin 37Db-like [Drosophila biarmipes]
MSALERIGTRYFYVVKNVKLNSTMANSFCRDMGGYLAAFQDQVELDAIKDKLKDEYFWLGINDRDNEGEFLSVVSGKPAKYLNWQRAQLDDDENNEDCVHIYGSKRVPQNMNDLNCAEQLHFICQFDNEI